MSECQARSLLKRLVDDNTEKDSTVWFAGEKCVYFIVKRELLQEVHDYIDRKDIIEKEDDHA